MGQYIDIVFDGWVGRFVEVEDANGKSIRVGQWIERKDGKWVLRIKREDFTDDGKDKAAQSMGQRGGKARARVLSAKRRKEIAKENLRDGRDHQRYCRPSGVSIRQAGTTSCPSVTMLRAIASCWSIRSFTDMGHISRETERGRKAHRIFVETSPARDSAAAGLHAITRRVTGNNGVAEFLGESHEDHSVRSDRPVGSGRRCSPGQRNGRQELLRAAGPGVLLTPELPDRGGCRHGSVAAHSARRGPPSGGRLAASFSGGNRVHHLQYERIKPSRYEHLPHGFRDGVGSGAHAKLRLSLF